MDIRYLEPVNKHDLSRWGNAHLQLQLGGSLLNMTGVTNGTTFNYLTQLGYDKFETQVFMHYGNGTEMTYTFGAQRRELAQDDSENKVRPFHDGQYLNLG